MNHEVLVPARALREAQPSLAVRLELLRLRAASDRLAFCLARQELQRRTEKLRRGANWAMALARVVSSRRGGKETGERFSWLRLAAWSAPILVPILVRMFGRRSSGARVRRASNVR